MCTVGLGRVEAWERDTGWEAGSLAQYEWLAATALQVRKEKRQIGT
jgi:hypothetical protein